MASSGKLRRDILTKYSIISLEKYNCILTANESQLLLLDLPKTNILFETFYNLLYDFINDRICMSMRMFIFLLITLKTLILKKAKEIMLIKTFRLI